LNKLGILGIAIAAALIPFNIQTFAASQETQADYYFQEGFAALNFGEYKKAIKHFDRVINLDPNYIDAYINKGIAFHELGNFEEAISNYDKALEIEPDNPIALNNKGYVFSKMKKYDEAVPYYNRALEINPTYLDAMYNRANAFWKQWYCEDAIIYLDQIIEIDPEPSQAYLQKAWALAGLGLVEDAILNLDRALERDPNILKPFDHTFVVNIDQNRWSEESWQELLQKHPNVWKGVNDKLVGFLVLSMDKAEIDVICIKPGGPDLYVEPELDDKSLAIESHLLQGTLALKNERYWDAISSFDNALVHDPDNVDALYNKGLALEALGLDNDAKINFDKVKKLESSPKIPDWIRNNAEWWAQGAIGDSDFVSGIQYLIKEGILQIPKTTQTSSSDGTEEIPSWIKNNADWWSQGLISDGDFVKGIQYLVEQGIIKV